VRITFLELPEAERRLYIEEAAARRGVSAVIIEKDFWVSWMLAVLFRSEFAGSLVFKGGTSLSKVFGAIDRFSEDIDLSLAPSFVGVDAPGDDASRTKLDRWMQDAQDACAATLRHKVKPALDTAIMQALGPAGEANRLEHMQGNGNDGLTRCSSLLSSEVETRDAYVALSPSCIATLGFADHST
jgi:hypothetical protein